MLSAGRRSSHCYLAASAHWHSSILSCYTWCLFHSSWLTLAQYALFGPVSLLWLTAKCRRSSQGSKSPHHENRLIWSSSDCDSYRRFNSLRHSHSNYAGSISASAGPTNLRFLPRLLFELQFSGVTTAEWSMIWIVEDQLDLKHVINLALLSDWATPFLVQLQSKGCSNLSAWYQLNSAQSTQHIVCIQLSAAPHFLVSLHSASIRIAISLC